jgi:hypothetical protein
VNEKPLVDTERQTGVYSIAESAKPLRLSRAEESVVTAMREAGKRGKSWMLVLSGNSAGVRIIQTIAPRWEPK